MEKRAKEGEPTSGPLKKTHLGLAGLITVLIQYGVGSKSESTVREAIMQANRSQISELRAEMETRDAHMREERERDFVRKTEINPALKSIRASLSKVLDVQAETNNKVSKIEGYLKAKRLFSSDSDLVPDEEVAHQ